MIALAPRRLALAALLAALPWLDPFAGGPSPSVLPWLASAACGLLLWILAATGPAQARVRVAAPLLALALWAVVASGGVRPDVAFLAGGLLLVGVGAQSATDDAVAHGLQLGLLVAAALSALVGLVQYFGFADALSPFVSRAVAGEAFGNLRQPNQYATLLWIGAAVVLWGPLRLGPLAGTALIVLLAVGSAASVSRTAILQGLLLTVLAACWPGPQRRVRLAQCAAAAVAYLLAALLLPTLVEALSGALPARTLWGRIGGPEGCTSRLVLWSNVLHLIAERPLAGWGWGELDYAHFMTLYPGRRFCDILDNAHNLPLHLAVELGVPAAVLVCVAGAWWVARQRPWSEAAGQRRLAWAIVALILLHSLLEYPLWYGPFQLAFGAAVGWLAVSRESAPWPRGWSVATALLLLVPTAYAAWDYERVSQIYLSPQERIAAWRADTLAVVRRSWLFAGQARFADLTLAEVSAANATRMHALALEMLHYSPEPRVIERAIESATLLGREDEAVQLLARYRAAFPAEYRAWQERSRAPGGQAQTSRLPRTLLNASMSSIWLGRFSRT